MKYLSVCSGIEAASVAWGPLGWTPVAFSEIDPFASAVLAERFPRTPNLGDMTKYHEWNIQSIDVLAGGTPCQSFSVAGKRGSLDDARGNLCLTFCRIADRFNPRWILWENVPGVLNTPDNAFGCLLGELCGAGTPVIPPGGRGKHPNCGVVAGPKRTVAWRVLDAQWFGVPQRRKRVFVLTVAGSRNWACADALLPVGESVPGNLEARRKARQDAPGDAGSRPEGSHWDGGPHPMLYAHKSGVGLSDQELFRQRGAYFVPDVAPTIDASYGNKWTGDQYVYSRGYFVCERHDNTPVMLTSAGFGGFKVDDVASTLTTRCDNPSRSGAPIVMHLQQDPITSSDVTGKGWGADGDPMYTLTAGGKTPGVVYCIRGNIIGRQDHNGGNGIGYTEDICATLTKSDVHAVACSYVVRRLTPRECERLQGFPDDWTRIPYRGKQADDCPDSPRYKAAGNSWAVPVVRWIGWQIEKMERRANEAHS